MQIHLYDSAAQVGQAAATLIAAQIIAKPDSVLGLATGSTPIPTYQELIRLCKGGVSGSLPCRAPSTWTNTATCPWIMNRATTASCASSSLTTSTSTPPTPACPMATPAIRPPNAPATTRPSTRPAGSTSRCWASGATAISASTDPADTFVYGCHIVNLTQSTIQANRRFFESEDDVPRQAISLGIGSIMNARRILLLATGADKAEAIRNAVYGDINPRTQASILRTHSNVIFLLDKAAAGLL